MPVHEVLIPLFEGVQPLDVAGPHEVLVGSGQLVEHRGSGPGYRVSLVAERPGPVRGHSGLQLVADGPLPDSGPIGTLLVPGGTAVLAMSGADPFVDWLRRAADRAERVVSVCTGSFALAAAGLLDGLCATTHWHYAAERHFSREFTRALGCPPGDYVEQVRVDTARRLLESEPVLVAVAAARAGFGSAETMRRAFLRRLGVPPDHYRRRFAVHN